MMKLILVMITILGLTACAKPPQLVADFYNGRDPCQKFGKEPGYERPNYCQRTVTSRTVIIDKVAPNTYSVRN